MLTETDTTARSVAARWGANVADGGAGTGWTPVPAALIRNIHELGLKPNDVAVLLAILVYWWDADRMPEPRLYTIARHVGLNRRTVERSVQRLRTLGLIRWAPSHETARGKRRAFDLQGLRDRVNTLAARDRETFLAGWRRERLERPEDVDEVFLVRAGRHDQLMLPSVDVDE